MGTALLVAAFFLAVLVGLPSLLALIVHRGKRWHVVVMMVISVLVCGALSPMTGLIGGIVFAVAYVGARKWLGSTPVTAQALPEGWGAGPAR